MRVTISGTLPRHVSAKDIALALIRKISSKGAVGHAIEFAGETVRNLDMAGRMTLCNMAIEAGSRIGLIAPDEITFTYLEGLPRAPRGAMWDQAMAYWRSLRSDDDAPFDKEIAIDVTGLAPQVSWGTSPDQAVAVDEGLPRPDHPKDAEQQAQQAKALDYMGLSQGAALSEVPITHVFIGSCTNSRIEDLRVAANIVLGRKIADTVKAIVVPGSALTKLQAEREGLDRIFLDAGMEWRNPGCSMCVAMNEDRLGPGDRCASTSNRNFEGRQGKGGRTHLMSPAMAAAAALAGHVVDVREIA